jgi:hypothetical protein
MGRRKNPDGPSKPRLIRLSPRENEWLDTFGFDRLHQLIQNDMTGRSHSVLDLRLSELKDEREGLELKLLDVSKRIRELEDQKMALTTAQVEYLTVRSRLVERFMKDPANFMGWLTGPANEHLIAEGQFNDPREVYEMCKKEWEKRKG